MTANREELHRLIDALPEETVPLVLTELRDKTIPAAERPWPPSWFGAGKARRPDVSERAEQILRDELARRQG